MSAGMDGMEELLPEFLAEAAELLEKAMRDLDGFLAASDRVERLDSIYRGIHTVKGSSSMFGFQNTKAVAHELESFLGGLKADPSAIGDTEIALIRGDISRIEELLRAKDQPPGESVAACATPQAETQAQMPAAASQTPPQQQVQAAAVASQAPPKSSQPASEEAYVRVPVKRLNETLNMVSEIFLIRNQLVYLVEQLKSSSTSKSAVERRDFIQGWELLDGELRRSLGDLERSAMGMRMMSVQSLFSRMARTVETYVSQSGPNGKLIAFETSGETTELDKKVLDSLGEPLIHLIRNAMDHGIEDRSERTRVGKSERGTIRLSASVVGNEVQIQVQDDGKGISAEKILKSAREKGLDVSQVTDEKSAIELIFLPGFSTAEKVTDVSGRGVGMDAVRSSIQRLGGRISITTEVGRGSVFSIRLPLSMSVAPCLLFEVNGLKYAVPNQEILEARVVPARDFVLNASRHYLKFRDRFIQAFDARPAFVREASAEESTREASVLIAKTDGEPRAIRVSRLEKTIEIVAKAVPAFAPKHPFVSGASVLPTGEPVFILSLERLMDTLADAGAAGKAAASAGGVADEAA